MVVNDAFRLVPDAGLVYACDGEWWDRYHDDVVHTMVDGALWTTSDEAAKRHKLHHVPGNHHEAQNGSLFDVSGKGITYGGNSGFQLINLAYMLGHRSVVLLGYDMGHDKGTPKHFFGEHPPALEKPSPYPKWVHIFNQAAPVMRSAGLTVINASRKTRLECFRRVTMDELVKL